MLGQVQVNKTLGQKPYKENTGEEEPYLPSQANKVKKSRKWWMKVSSDEDSDVDSIKSKYICDDSSEYSFDSDGDVY